MIHKSTFCWLISDDEGHFGPPGWYVYLEGVYFGTIIENNSKIRQFDYLKIKTLEAKVETEVDTEV